MKATHHVIIDHILIIVPPSIRLVYVTSLTGEYQLVSPTSALGSSLSELVAVAPKYVTRLHANFAADIHGSAIVWSAAQDYYFAEIYHG